jgi:PcfJ-like protein
MRIEWNKEDNTISVGKAVFISYENQKSRSIWVAKVLRLNDIYIPSGHPKQTNKLIQEALKGSAPGMFKHFQALQYKAFVLPYKNILTKVAFTRGRIDTKALAQVKHAWNYLQQAEKDGLSNILPIITYANLPPAELKKKFGKNWKVLANNSLNKNKAVISAITSRFASDIHGNTLKFMENLVDLPTTVLRNHPDVSTDGMRYIASNFKGRWNQKLTSEKRFYRDSEQLAAKLDTVINPKWSYRRLKEEHDKWSRELAMRTNSPDKFESVKNIIVKEHVFNGYVATLLDSAYLIANEGLEMGHCVAGYIDSCRNGNYLVYSITKEGKKSSTFGVNVTQAPLLSPRKQEDKAVYVHMKKDTYRFSQHYKQFNAYITDPDEKEIAYAVLNLLQTENTEIFP